MPKIKHYVLTSITLGSIAAASALLIGGANLLTKDKIKINEQNNVYRGIAEIFGDSASILNDEDIKKDSYNYVEHVYEIANNSKESGYAFRTTGSNMYGKISLIIGIDLNFNFIKLSIVTNEQTYAATLVENYINPLNNSTHNLDDVSCGATYGAKLVRDMVNEAKQASLEKVWKK